MRADASDLSDDENGNVLGYIAEEERGFLGTFARQLFRTHRAFRSVIMDKNGTPVLWVSESTSILLELKLIGNINRYTDLSHSSTRSYSFRGNWRKTLQHLTKSSAL